jgi:lytic murein transglycosylase
MIVRLLTAVSFSLALLLPAAAAQCGGNFSTFINQMARKAQGAGISPAVISQAFRGLSPDPKVMRFDRRQRRSFGHRSFESFARTRVTTARLKRARGLMRRHAALLNRVERRYGVPKELIMAIWTMESDNGRGDIGKLSVVRTVATLAHDCRRSEFFQNELIATLTILQRGDLPMSDLKGGFAGELGQTQFLPTSYIKYGVDFDGNGHVDLRHSVPDVLASTANLLRVNGWQAGAPYQMGTTNFQVMREWNRSEVYRRALVLFAQKLG